MAKSAIQQEVRELKAERSRLDERIKHLENYLGTYNGGSVGVPSGRGGPDIRPAIRELFAANGNTPMKAKDIVSSVAHKLGIDKFVVDKKMAYAKTAVLQKAQGQYGMYHLKDQA